MGETARTRPSRTVPLLVAAMLVTGCANSLLTKAQDMVCVQDCGTPKPRLYNQPIYQTLVMFAGEFLCLIALYGMRWTQMLRRPSTGSTPIKGKYEPLPTYDAAGDSGLVLPAEAYATAPVHIKGGQNIPHGSHGAVPVPTAVALLDEVQLTAAEPLSWRTQMLFAVPTCFDLLGTTAMNLGLVLVDVSVYQLLRGALVLWVGCFSVLFLRRHLTRSQWGALVLVMLGVAVVGLSSILTAQPLPVGDDAPAPGSEQRPDMGRTTIGICLVLFAQIFTASQFCVEEAIMTKHSIEPLRAVGLEGLFGLLSTLLVMIALHAGLGSTDQGRGGIFDIVNGWHELVDNRSVWLTSCAIACSIALFNAAGLGVTRSISAAARSTIDSCRTVGIWACSLLLGWEMFRPLQVAGFLLLVYGTFVFNGVLHFPDVGAARGRAVHQTSGSGSVSGRSSSSRPTSRPATLSRRSTSNIERQRETTPLLET